MLITGPYLKEQRRMHLNGRYGAASKKFAGYVAALIVTRNPRSILDYGAGKCALREALGDLIDGREFVEYDPGVKAISKAPKAVFDMVACIDVLEHIEPKCLKHVLTFMRARVGKFAFLTIHTGPAGKVLSDGRNAHLIQCPISWWTEVLSRYFASVQAELINETTAVVVCEV